MCYFIGIESLVANALIELLRDGCRQVKFEAIERYGAEVVNILNNSGEDAVLILSRERTRGFIINCSDYFDVENPELPSGTISLKPEFSEDDLLRVFCGGIAAPVLRALISEKSLEVLRAA